MKFSKEKESEFLKSIMVAFAQQTFENLEMKVQIVFRHMNNLDNAFKIEKFE